MNMNNVSYVDINIPFILNVEFIIQLLMIGITFLTMYILFMSIAYIYILGIT